MLIQFLILILLQLSSLPGSLSFKRLFDMKLDSRAEFSEEKQEWFAMVFMNVERKAEFSEEKQEWCTTVFMKVQNREHR